MANEDQQIRIDTYIRDNLDPYSAANFEEAYLQDADCWLGLSWLVQ